MGEDATAIEPMQPGVMYAVAAYDGNPISRDRLEWISRWGGATEEEARCMAADLWQRQGSDHFAENWEAAKAAAKARATPIKESKP